MVKIMNRKNIIEEIQKMAEKISIGAPLIEPKKPVATSVVSPTIKPADKSVAKPISAKPYSGISSDSSIIGMQKAIKEFSNKLSPKTKTIDGVEHLGGEGESDPQSNFNDFLVEQYSEKAPIHGKELSTDSTVSTAAKPTRLYQMSSVLDNLQKIGTSKNPIDQFKIDGNWGPKTNNAVLHIISFAYTFNKITQDFAVETKNTFSSEDLKTLSDNSIKSEELRLTNESIKSKKAGILTPLIKKLGDYYEEYTTKIAKNPQFVRSIEGEVPLFTSKKQDSAIVKPELQSYMSKLNELSLLDVDVPGPFGLVKLPKLSLESIKDRESFMQLMSSLKYNASQASNPRIQKTVLDAIMSHVSTMNKDFSGVK